MKPTPTLVFAAALAGAGFAAAQAGGIAQARALAASAEAYSKKAKPLILADVAKDGRPARWKEFASENLREKADTGDNLNSNAYIWRRNGKVLLVNMTLQSPSRDWSIVARYTYRPDGTLAVLASDLNSFHTEVNVRREYVFDARGTLLKKSVKAFEMGSDKPKKGEHFDQAPPIYARVGALPFARMLGSRR